MSNVAIFPRTTQLPSAPSRARQVGIILAGLFSSFVSNWTSRRKLQAVPDYLLEDVGLSRGQIQQIRDYRRGTFRSGNIPGHFCY